MDPFYINVGHWLKYPYESDYSMWRRCLVVNPGVPLYAIQLQLRMMFPDLKSPTQRLQQLQLHPPSIFDRVILFDDHSYQCPECARSLYP